MRRVHVSQRALELNRRGGDRPAVVLADERTDRVHATSAHRIDLLVGGQLACSVVQHERASVVIEIADGTEVRIGFRDGAAIVMQPSTP